MTYRENVDELKQVARNAASRYMAGTPPITDDGQIIMDAANLILALESQLAAADSLAEAIERYAKSPGGRWLTVDQVLDIRHQLKQIQRRLADSRPFAQCKNWPNCKRGCRVCDGAGWIPKRLKEAVK